ncbi:MAG: hypothetical protein ACK5NT_05775 [Pyrinomonadaceae bacterium]
MKKFSTLILVLIMLLFVGMGCGIGRFVGSGSSDDSKKTSQQKETGSGETADTESAKEQPPSGEKIELGIPECDELATYVNDNTEEIEGSIAGRVVLLFYKNMILDKLREGVKDMTEEQKAEMGKTCSKTLEDVKKSVEK